MKLSPRRGIARSMCLLCSLAVSSVICAAPTGAAALVDPGQRALLTVAITVQGAVEESKGYRDEVVKWSTQRSLDATVEMEAGELEKMSVTAGVDAGQQAAMESIQKQAQACGDDQACQIRVAMQMMNSPELQGSSAGPPRYQLWRPVEDSGQLKVTASHEDKLHTVFYTAARETTDCTLTAPKRSPALPEGAGSAPEQWAAKNQEALESSARSFTVEVDGAGNTGVLSINSVLPTGFGDTLCVQNIGSGPETSHRADNPTLLPQHGVAIPLHVPGTSAPDGVIASGTATLEASQELNHLGVGFAVGMKAPLKLTVRWELKRL